jgi:hypothetical protein
VPYLVGIFAGGIIAGLVHTLVFKPVAEPATTPDYPLTEKNQR